MHYEIKQKLVSINRKKYIHYLAVLYDGCVIKDKVEFIGRDDAIKFVKDEYKNKKEVFS